MYNLATIQPCLASLVKFSTDYGTKYEVLTPSLTSATALMTINEIHPLVNMENITDCFRSFIMQGIEGYTSTQTYSINQRVSYGLTSAGLPRYWKAKLVALNQTPAENTYWTEVFLISEQLTQLINGSAEKLMGSVMGKKKLNQTVKTIIEDFVMFEGRADVANVNGNLGRFVGFKFDVRNLQDLSIYITSLSFQLDAPKTFNLYLFHSSCDTPLETFEVAYTKAGGSVEWFTTDFLMKYISSVNDTGIFYIGYYQSDLDSVRSIRKSLNYVSVTGGCDSCDGSYRNLFHKRSGYVNVQPFYIDSFDGTMWDESEEVNVDDNNYGMNFTFSVRCDLDEFICRNKSVFAEAMAYQVTVDLLRKFAFTMKDSGFSDRVRNEANFALQNGENYTKGMDKVLSEKIDAVSFDISQLNKICLPCENKKMIRRGAF